MSTIRLVIILAVLLLALSFFGISIRSIIESPTGKDNFTFIWQLISTGWHLLVVWFGTFFNLIETLAHQSGSAS